MAHGGFDLGPGDLFNERYEVVRPLSVGGMGAVYEALHVETRRRRALKLMRPELLGDAGARARFKLEAQVAANIESEHIVEVVDAGVDARTGAPFIVMELLRGEDLGAVLAKRGRLPAGEVVELLAQAARALDRTHAAGIVHRDLKPENLFLTAREDGSARVKVLDFGIAKVLEESRHQTRATASIGTPVFMAPEQISGAPIGPAADVYALGHIAYDLLCGEAYWDTEAGGANVYSLLVKIGAGAREPAVVRAARGGTSLPPAFEVWFQRATALAPEARFRSAGEMVTALAARARRGGAARREAGVAELACPRDETVRGWAVRRIHRLRGDGGCRDRACSRKARGPLRGGRGVRRAGDRRGYGASRGDGAGLRGEGLDRRDHRPGRRSGAADDTPSHWHLRGARKHRARGRRRWGPRGRRRSADRDRRSRFRRGIGAGQRAAARGAGSPRGDQRRADRRADHHAGRGALGETFVFCGGGAGPPGVHEGRLGASARPDAHQSASHPLREPRYRTTCFSPAEGTTMSTKRWTRALAFALGLAVAGSAAAQPKRDPAAADEAFRAAVAAKLKGDLKTACAKFDASMQLDPSPSTLLNVAECLEHDGKLARAWSEAQRARVLNTETPGDQRRRELDAYATTTLERLRAKLAWIQIVAKGAPAGLSVEKDGVAIPAAILDQAIPADPGASKVKASAPGYRTFEVDLALSEGKTTNVTIALSPAPPAPPASVSASAGSSGAPLAPPPPRPIWPWIAGGAGLALVGASVGFAIAQAGTQANIDVNCNQQPDGRCLVGYPYQAQNDALFRDFGLALGFGIAGAAGVAAGVFGLVRGPARPSAAPAGTTGILSRGPLAGSLVVVPHAGPESGGLSIAGAF